MKKLHDGREDGLSPAGWPELLTLCVFFALGVTCGWFLSGRIELKDSGLSEYLGRFFEQAAAQPPLYQVLWDVFRWPLLAFLLGFTSLGALCIPAAFLVRGFLMAFAVSSFARLYAGQGLLMACAVFGVSGCLVIPVFFVLGTQSFGASKKLAAGMLSGAKGRLPFSWPYFLRALFCVAFLLGAAALEYWLVPFLLTESGTLFSI